jgi:uncharacterized membrane protein (GlpM family)
MKGNNEVPHVCLCVNRAGFMECKEQQQSINYNLPMQNRRLKLKCLFFFIPSQIQGFPPFSFLQSNIITNQNVSNRNLKLVIYLGKKDIYCIFKTCCTVFYFSQNDIYITILFHSVQIKLIFTLLIKH